MHPRHMPGWFVAETLFHYLSSIQLQGHMLKMYLDVVAGKFIISSRCFVKIPVLENGTRSFVELKITTAVEV